MAFTLLQQGSFTSDGTEKLINLPGTADYFIARNLTQEATTQTPGRAVKCEWYAGGLVARNSQIRTFKSAGANTLESTVDSSGGFIYYGIPPAPEAEVTGTAITAANPAVVTMTNTYSEGDRVRLYGTTGMRQISGMDFTISSVSGAGFTLLGLNASGFAAAATAVRARRIPQLEAVEPPFLYVTGITQATSAVVSVSTAHNYVVDQLITFRIPSSFGMTQMDGLTGKITAISTYGFTVDIDSSAFSAFAFPADTGVPTVRLFATVGPSGQRNAYNVDFVPFRSGSFIPFMLLNAGAQSPAGSSGDVIVWQAWKKEN